MRFYLYLYSFSSIFNSYVKVIYSQLFYVSKISYRSRARARLRIQHIHYVSRRVRYALSPSNYLSISISISTSYFACSHHHAQVAPRPARCHDFLSQGSQGNRQEGCAMRLLPLSIDPSIAISTLYFACSHHHPQVAPRPARCHDLLPQGNQGDQQEGCVMRPLPLTIYLYLYQYLHYILRVATTTHKSLRGPRGAMIFYRKGVEGTDKKSALCALSVYLSVSVSISIIYFACSHHYAQKKRPQRCHHRLPQGNQGNRYEGCAAIYMYIAFHVCFNSL